MKLFKPEQNRAPRLLAVVVGLVVVSSVFLFTNHSRLFSFQHSNNSSAEKTSSLLTRVLFKSAGKGSSGVDSEESLNARIRRISTNQVQAKLEIDKIIESISSKELASVIASLWEAELTGARRDITQQLLRRWAEEAPQNAAAWILQQPPGSMQREGAVAIATIWANRNLPEAADWARQLPEADREASLLAIGFEAARNSPKEALKLATELTPNGSRDDLVAHSIRQWMVTDPEEPAAWAEKIEPSLLKDQVFANLSVALSETDPVSAAEMALQKIPPGTLQNNAVVSIVQRWAQEDPNAAAEWVTRFPEGQLRETALENLVQLWANKDPEQAADWLETLSLGQTRDVALSSYASTLVSSDPALAVKWAEEITDPTQRQKEIEIIAGRWLAINNADARAWIQAAALSDESKSRLLANSSSKNIN